MAHLRKILAVLSVFNALMMSQELQGMMIFALQNLEQCKTYFVDKNLQETLYNGG